LLIVNLCKFIAMTSQIIYKGELRTEATHLQSGTVIQTDAPTDNQGKGEKFSPTDLLATSLGNCMMTIMGIKARDMQVDLANTKIDVTKIMNADPRRVGGIQVQFHFPTNLHLDEKQQKILENAALTCPVAKSIHPDIALDVNFNWKTKDEVGYDVK
jgi:putative redox protein